MVYRQVDREVSFGSLLPCEHQNEMCRCFGAIPAVCSNHKILAESMRRIDLLPGLKSGDSYGLHA